MLKNVKWPKHFHSLPVASLDYCRQALKFEQDTPQVWIIYLESLGLKEVKQVCYEDFWEDRLYCP